MENTLTLATLGGLQIRQGEVPLIGFESLKAQALLIYLAVERREHSRLYLAGLFWGDRIESRALGNLRRVLTNLRNLVGDHLHITSQTVAFDAQSDYWLDVDEFAKLGNWQVRQTDCRCSGLSVDRPTILSLYRGDFLAGLYLDGCPAFEEWMLGWRERLHMVALSALHNMVTYHVERGEHELAIAWAGRLLALDPWREETHRQLMLLLALSGQRSAALAQYEECRRLLETELGVEPLEETTALYRRLLEWDASMAGLADRRGDLLPGRSHLLPFVGRGEEHAHLVEWWEAARNGQGRLTLVVGEAGIGKSRLVEQVLGYASGQGAVVLRGRCYEFGGGVPYQPIAAALRSAFQDRERATEVRQRISNLEPAWLAELAHLLPELHVAGPDMASGAFLAAETARQRLFEAVARFLQAGCCAQIATCVFLDDLHWADASTLDLLHYLARTLEKNPIWLIGAYRPEEISLGHPLNRLRQGLSRDHQVNMLTLPPLSLEAVEQIVCSLVGVKGGGDLGSWLYRESEGNPFILVEMVNDLQEQGALRKGESGIWQWAGFSPAAALPVSVQDVILQRVGRLIQPAQRLLALAAVIGRQFDSSLLRAAAGQDAAAVEASLDEWLARHLVRPEARVKPQTASSFLQYDFCHDKIRAVIYHAVGAAQRKMLHRQVGAALEQVPGEHGEAQVGILAYHWEQAGEVAKATPYLLRAGDQARLVYAHQEAIDYYQRALVLLQEQSDAKEEQMARTLIKMGLTYHNAFDFQQARQAYDKGFALWQQVNQARPVQPLPPAARPLRVRWLEPVTLDPTMSPDVHTSNLLGHLFSGLVELNSEMDVVPDVARTWKISEGGREFVFSLRPDVRWSDGQPVTAGDFEYAWKRLLTIGSPAASFMYDIKGAQAAHQKKGRPEDIGLHALDETTLVVELAEPVGFFMQLLAHTPFYPVPRHVVEVHGTAWTEMENMVTNGPFRLRSWDRGEKMVLARNPHYHGHFSGNVQQVELFPLTDWAARLQMYEADELDVLGITHFGPAERENARQRHAGEYLSVPRMGTYYLVFDVSRPPFDDVRVRRAFALTTDKERLVDVALQGYLSPATGGFVPPGMPGHSPGIGLSCDLGRARDLLAEAGYPGGHGFPIIDALTFQAIEARSAFLQGQWRENLGIEISWTTVEWAEFLARLDQKPPHLFCAVWVADYPDPDNLMRVCRAATWAGWRNAHYDELVERARRVMDQKGRLDLYRQADHVLVEEMPILPLAYEREHLLIKARVGRYPTSVSKAMFWKDVIIKAHE